MDTSLPFLLALPPEDAIRSLEMPAEISRSQWSSRSPPARIAAAALHRLLRLRWRRGGREWAVGACGLGMFLLAVVLAIGSLAGRHAGGGGAYQVGSHGYGGDIVPLTLLRNAKDRGAGTHTHTLSPSVFGGELVRIFARKFVFNLILFSYPEGIFCSLFGWEPPCLPH